jgi:hypothetical protein
MKTMYQEEKDKIISQYTSSPISKHSKSTFNIGPLQFGTKGVSQWLKHSYDGYEVNDKDKEWIYPLIYKHPNYIDKLAFHNGKIVILLDKSKRFYNFNLGKVQDSMYSREFFEPMSYIKCFTPSLSNNHVYNCRSAFRNEIRYPLEYV